MSTSCGGGYCDCGDSEAWSDFVHCTAHSVGGAGAVAGSPNADPVSITVFCWLEKMHLQFCYDTSVVESHFFEIAYCKVYLSITIEFHFNSESTFFLLLINISFLQALKLPPDIQKRAQHIFYSVLNYAYEILTTESMLTLPADLTFKVNHDGTELVNHLFSVLNKNNCFPALECLTLIS